MSYDRINKQTNRDYNFTFINYYAEESINSKNEKYKNTHPDLLSLGWEGYKYNAVLLDGCCTG